LKGRNGKNYEGGEKWHNLELGSSMMLLDKLLDIAVSWGILIG